MSLTPLNEEERVKALKIYNILDTQFEQCFDNLAGLAATICETPMCAISLIDTHRQWFKSKIGLNVRETARDIAFCSHAILQDEIFLVPDALEDHRFRANPLVLSSPNVRFYAGAPLKVMGNLNIGTLCVLDSKPRKISEGQLTALATLRDAVITQLEMRKAVSDLRALQELLPICAWCKQIQAQDGAWKNVHEYVATEAGITHSICPNCLKSQSP